MENSPALRYTKITPSHSVRMNVGSLSLLMMSENCKYEQWPSPFFVFQHKQSPSQSNIARAMLCPCSLPRRLVCARNGPEWDQEHAHLAVRQQWHTSKSTAHNDRNVVVQLRRRRTPYSGGNQTKKHAIALRQCGFVTQVMPLRRSSPMRSSSAMVSGL